MGACREQAQGGGCLYSCSPQLEDSDHWGTLDGAGQGNGRKEGPICHHCLASLGTGAGGASGLPLPWSRLFRTSAWSPLPLVSPAGLGAVASPQSAPSSEGQHRWHLNRGSSHVYSDGERMMISVIEIYR